MTMSAELKARGSVFSSTSPTSGQIVDLRRRGRGGNALAKHGALALVDATALENGASKTMIIGPAKRASIWRIRR